MIQETPDPGHEPGLLTASAGWAAPTETIYAQHLPEVQVRRGGIRFDRASQPLKQPKMRDGRKVWRADALLLRAMYQSLSDRYDRQLETVDELRREVARYVELTAEQPQ